MVKYLFILLLCAKSIKYCFCGQKLGFYKKKLKLDIFGKSYAKREKFEILSYKDLKM